MLVVLLHIDVLSYSHLILHIQYYFFFNDTATTEIYTLSLHDALPISRSFSVRRNSNSATRRRTSSGSRSATSPRCAPSRSEEHTSELQSLAYLVCRLLLEKKKIAIDEVRHNMVIPESILASYPT